MRSGLVEDGSCISGTAVLASPDGGSDGKDTTMRSTEIYARDRAEHVAGIGILRAWGDIVPPDGEPGYATGCLFQHTDGGPGTSLYANEGTLESCDFNPLVTS